MKLVRHLIAFVILLPFIVPVSVASGNGDHVIVSSVINMFHLDPLAIEIEVLSNQLEGRHLTDSSLSLRPLTQKEPVGLFTVLATLTENGETVATGQVRMRIRKYAEVLVANDRIKRGDIIDSTRVLVQRMEVTNLIEQPLTSAAELVGFRAKRNLKKGTIVTTGSIEAIPDIESGVETLIIYNDGLCRVTAPGVALQPGAAGEYIKVRNKATKKIIMARVIDDRAVEVDP